MYPTWATPVNGTRWCSHIDHSSMSRTSTISSCPMSKVVVSTSSGRCRMPAVSSAYARATRWGVSRSPSRSGSSPIAISSSRTAAAARSWSNAGTSAGERSGQAIASVMRRGSGRWLGDGRTRPDRPAVHVAAGPRRGQDRARLGLGLGAVGLGPVADRLRDLDGRDLRRVAVGRPGPRGPRRAQAQLLEDGGDLLLVERLLVHQLEHQAVEDVAVLLEDVEGLLVGVGQELLGLLVDDRGDVLGVVLGVPEVAAQERLAVALAELDRTEPVGHAVLGDHRPGHRGRLLDVVAGAGGGVVEDHLLRSATAHHVGQRVEQLAAGLAVLVV